VTGPSFIELLRTTERQSLGHFGRSEVMCQMAGPTKSRRPALHPPAITERQRLRPITDVWSHSSMIGPMVLAVSVRASEQPSSTKPAEWRYEREWSRRHGRHTSLAASLRPRSGQGSHRGRADAGGLSGTPDRRNAGALSRCTRENCQSCRGRLQPIHRFLIVIRRRQQPPAES
jgi:hypothetical protein